MHRYRYNTYLCMCLQIIEFQSQRPHEQASVEDGADSVRVTTDSNDSTTSNANNIDTGYNYTIEFDCRIRVSLKLYIKYVDCQ